MKARIEPEKCILKKLRDDFAKCFYFQSDGFKNLSSEVS
jgi:hypothetical protein